MKNLLLAFFVLISPRVYGQAAAPYGGGGPAAAAAPNGAAGGVLAGNYPSPTLGASVVLSTHIAPGAVMDSDTNLSTAAIATGVFPTSKGGTGNTTGQAASVASGGVDFSTITTALAGKLGTGGTAFAVASGGVDFSTITTALAGKLSTTGTAAAVASGGVNFSTITAAILAPASLTVGTGVLFSSAPIGHVSGVSVVGALTSGTTFMTFTPDAPITLRRISADVIVAGVAGTGDTITCNNSAGTSTISVTLSAAATAGTTATAQGSANIAYQAQVFCHIESGAATRPVVAIALEYIGQ